MQGVPYWRLSGLYLAYFAVVGIISPYWGLYLDFLGFTPYEIGVVLAVPMLTKIIGPNIWGWWADRLGRYVLVMRLGAAGAVVGVTGLLVVFDYWKVLLFTLLFTFFWNAILPQFEVITLDSLGKNTQRYSQIRVWGSVGFIFASMFLGVIFDQFSLSLLPAFLFIFLVFILLATFGIKEPEMPHSHQLGVDLAPRSRLALLACFLLSAFLLHVSHGVYYGFYSLYLKEYGYSTGMTGVLWSVGVIAEIVLFLKMPWVLRRWSLWSCLLACLLAAAARWWLIGWFPQSLLLLLFAQLLHALTFALAHAVAIEMIRQLFPARNRGFGQGLYSAICFGAGGALGVYVCGVIWSHSMQAAFGFACVTVLLGILFAGPGLFLHRRLSLSYQ